MIYTRMGWLVPAIWLSAVALSSQTYERLSGQYAMGLGPVAFLFFLAAAMSTPLVWLAGAVLNREKVPTQIKPLGRPRVVYWGTHTFYLMPLGYWAIMIPAGTVLSYFVFKLV